MSDLTFEKYQNANIMDTAFKRPGQSCIISRHIVERIDVVYSRKTSKFYFYVIRDRASIQLLEPVRYEEVAGVEFGTKIPVAFKRLGNMVPLHVFSKIQQIRNISWEEFIEEFQNLKGDEVELYRIMYTLGDR